MNDSNFPLMSQSSKYSYTDKKSRPFSGLLPFQKRLVSRPPLSPFRKRGQGDISPLDLKISIIDASSKMAPPPLQFGKEKVSEEGFFFCGGGGKWEEEDAENFPGVSEQD